MWAIFPNLQEAFEVIKAWGFTYKTIAFVWIKKNKKADSLFWGLGHWTRANTEFCLLATKGNPRRASKSVHQVIMTPVEAHSKKPDEARDKIVRLMGDLPRIELFARQATPGWDVWGNEIQNTIPDLFKNYLIRERGAA
jgi:N6-adenosine-specific RNA methylase IME4